MKPLVVKNVSKTFKGKGWKVEALKKVDLEIKKGEIFGLLGPNGSGKTTLINVMTNMLTADEGHVKILGQDVGPEVLNQINIVSGGSQFHWAQYPKDILTFFSKVYQVKNHEKRIEELIKKFKMERILDRRFSWMSTGEKLRVAFAKALLNKPKVLLLDEPTLGLDPDVAQVVRKEIKKLRKEGTTILLTSHYMHEVEELCDRIAFIYHGEILEVGKVKEVKTKHFGTYDVILKLDKKPTSKLLKKFKLKGKGNTFKATFEREDSLTQLLAEIHKEKREVKTVEVKKATLEDYFLKILRK